MFAAALATPSAPPALTDDIDSRLSDDELRRIVRLVYERSGITLHAGKKALIVARLQKRLRAGGYSTFSEYLKAVDADPSGAELGALLDAITTNHTSFFREEQHFRVLESHVLPTLTGRAGPIRVWSAACSTGEEPTTLAVTMLEAGADRGRVRLLASDLSSRALATARAGVYRMDRVAGIPMDLLRRYFERGLHAQEGLARVAPAVRRAIEYRQLNLLEIGDLGERFDVIFCRNVMIYFDRDVQQRVVSMLERHLAPGGYLFISHSESLNGIAHQLRWVAPAVYRRAQS
ncbi:MAG: CheR family methyltransferase [Vicinamibacterales bacterium]